MVQAFRKPWGSWISKGSSRMPRSLAISWSWQLPLRTQVAHLQSCWDRMSSTLMRRVLRARGELVWTAMPSWTGLLQAVTMARSPSTSTQHTRQAAISLMPFR